MRLMGIWMLLGLTIMPLDAKQEATVEKRGQLKVIEVKEPDGQILSYRHGAGSTEVRMRGTRLAPEAQIRLKVGSRPGFVELDINRGNISGLKPAHQFGKDFLTYVLWAVSIDGRASNLGEITFAGERPLSINVTTPYQTFWLMLTAEPDYAVAEPSPVVVLYSVSQGATNEPLLEKRALTIRGNLFYFTNYTAYDSAPAAVERAPNELLQARKAVELASQSGILTADHPAGAVVTKEEELSREALKLATTFLTRAEDTYRKNPGSSEVVQFARTAAQIAENARSLSLVARGGVSGNQLESDVAGLRAELAGRQAALAKLQAALTKLQGELARRRGELAKLRAALTNLRAELAEAQAKLSRGPSKVAPPVETKAAEPPPSLASRPIVWFGFLGWALALLLLFRRYSA